ncbi:PDC sensor domain-containing protein [Devosia sp. FKR38]|uniref:PDC sensor domain-containing protein n=1 Tax=Devosia sp. FKR38 TaxID=2562312 RepID=UPI00197A824A|nr:PDC sensor domain-containing protein [Devosia sp. FKR38]
MTTTNLLRPGAYALGLVTLMSFGAATQAEDEFTAPLTALAQSEIVAIASDPAVISAIIAQNAVTASYDQAKIDELDKQWRAEVDAASKPLVDATLANAASQYLKGVQEASGGKYTEIFVMDAKGLNVAQSSLTSDYWQGDEDKFTASFGAGAGAVHVSDVEQDESTQVFQSQVSVPVADPATGNLIGAITVGVDVSML